jgi:hypothetical protein
VSLVVPCEQWGAGQAAKSANAPTFVAVVAIVGAIVIAVGVWTVGLVLVALDINGVSYPWWACFFWGAVAAGGYVTHAIWKATDRRKP